MKKKWSKIVQGELIKNCAEKAKRLCERGLKEGQQMSRKENEIIKKD